MKKIFQLILLLATFTAPITAQEIVSPDEDFNEDIKGIVYNREFTVDLKLHTNGYALGVNFGQLRTYYLTRYFNFEIGEIKHPKEYRQSFDFQAQTTGEVSRAFVFGKQNNFYVLRGGIGEKRYFSEKAERKGVAIGISYEAGPSLGLLKPYYLKLVRFPNPDLNDYVIIDEKFTEENADVFLEISRIYGSSGFSRGLGEISVLPGAHGKFAVHFDWGAFDEFVKALEAGIMVDFYFQTVPIMVDRGVDFPENRPMFFNLFLNLQLGKRW